MQPDQPIYDRPGISDHDPFVLGVACSYRRGQSMARVVAIVAFVGNIAMLFAWFRSHGVFAVFQARSLFPTLAGAFVCIDIGVGVVKPCLGKFSIVLGAGWVCLFIGGCLGYFTYFFVNQDVLQADEIRRVAPLFTCIRARCRRAGFDFKRLSG